MGKQAENSGEKEGVSAPINADRIGDRDSSGRFVPGHSIKGGRPSKARELAALDAVMNSVTPDKIAETIASLLNHPTSWRAQQAGLELHLAYTLGKPVQRIQQSEGGLSGILEELGDE
jgi:hypothetical protein